MTLMPLLVVALIVWAGVFAFLLGVENHVARLEKRIAAREKTVNVDFEAKQMAQKELGR